MREGAGLFASVFRRNPSAMAVLRASELRYVEVNESWLRLFEREREELVGQAPGDEAVLFSNATRARPPFSTVIGNGEREVEVRTKSGKPLTVLAATEVVSWDGEEHILCTAVDMTAQRDARDLLQGSVDKYRILFDSLDEGFCIIDVMLDESPVDYVFLEANRSFERQTGIRHCLGRRMREIVPGTEEHWFRFYGEVATSGIARRFTARTAAMRHEWYDVYAFRIGREGSRLVGVMFKDVTERMELERELRSERDRFSSLISSMQDEVWVTDEAGKLIMVNPAVAREFKLQLPPDGIGADQIASSYPVFRPDGTPRPPEEAPPLRALRGEVVESQEELVRTPATGELRHRQVNAAPILDPEGRIRGSVSVVRDVTQARAREESYRHLVQHAPAAIFDIDFRSSRFRKVNEAMSLLTGYTKDELLALDPGDLIEERDRPTFRQEVASRLVGENTSTTVEYRIMRKDGRRIHATFSLKPHYENGLQVGALVVGHDVTRLREAEEALQESQSTFLSLFSASNEGIALHEMVLERDGVARDYRILDVNPAFERVTELPRERAVGALASELYGTGEPPFLDIYAGVVRTGEPAFFETYFEPMKKHFQISVFRPKEGQFATTFVDISVMKEVQQQIEEQRARLQAIIDNTPDALVVVDDQARVLMTNRRTDEIYNRPMPYGQGYESHAALALYRPDGQPYAPRDLPLTRSALDGETFTDVDMDIVWPDGELRHLLVNSSPIHGEDGRRIGAVGSFIDITERRRTELELKRSNAELQEFAFIASHDMKEPLRMITAYLSLLDRQFYADLDPRAREYMLYVISGAERMRQLVNDLLQFSRVDTTTREFHPVDMNKVVRRVQEDLHFSITEAGAEVQVGTLPNVLADEPQMVQLLTNLIGNAIKFRGEEPPRVSVHCAPGYPGWTFAVHDNGIGIEPRYQGNLFKMFSRLHSRDEYPGTGIGLAISKKIVERHGGRIWVRSDGRTGTTFFFTLPRYL